MHPRLGSPFKAVRTAPERALRQNRMMQTMAEPSSYIRGAKRCRLFHAKCRSNKSKLSQHGRKGADLFEESPSRRVRGVRITGPNGWTAKFKQLALKFFAAWPKGMGAASRFDARVRWKAFVMVRTLSSSVFAAGRQLDAAVIASTETRMICVQGIFSAPCFD